MLQVSIILLTSGGGPRLARTLGALAGLDYRADRFEVVIADTANDPATDRLAADAGERVEARVVATPGGGEAEALNRAARRARGEVLACTHAGCVPGAGWLAALAAAMTQTGMGDKAGGVGGVLAAGRTVRAVGGIAAEAERVMLDQMDARPSRMHGPAWAHRFTTRNLAATARDFARRGGFDPEPRSALDPARDLHERWLSAGGEAVYQPRAVVEVDEPITLRGMIGGGFGLGVSRRRERPRGLRPLHETGVFYHELLARARHDPGPRSAMAVTAAVVAAQAAAVAGDVWENWRWR